MQERQEGIESRRHPLIVYNKYKSSRGGRLCCRPPFLNSVDSRPEVTACESARIEQRELSTRLPPRPNYIRVYNNNDQREIVRRAQASDFHFPASHSSNEKPLRRGESGMGRLGGVVNGKDWLAAS